jgi:hypothetical protein
VNGPLADDLEDRLRRSLRTVAHSTVVPPRPELAAPTARAGLRVLAIAAAVVALLGMIAFAELAGGLRSAAPSGPTTSSDDPFPAVQRLVSLDRPEQAKAELEATFRALDLDVTMRLVPVEPARVGQVLGVEGAIEVEDEACVAGVPGCRIQITVPAGFDGHGVVIVGVARGATVPEEFQLADDAFAAGQPLHCHSELLGARFGAAAPVVRRLGLKPRFEFEGNSFGDGADDSFYVTGARRMSGDIVLFDVQLGPYHPPAEVLRAVRAGC